MNILSVITPKLTDDILVGLKSKTLNTFINPYSYLIASKEVSAFEGFDNIYIDGGLLCNLLSVLRIKNVKRVSFDFSSIADYVFRHCINHNKSIYFIGSKESEIQKFNPKIRREYPQLNIVGTRNGYFTDNEKILFSKQINSIQPDIIVCGMGTPHQEQLLLLLRRNGWNGTGFTCGGFFHQTASSAEVDYYPSLINKLNLRWLYRIYDEPKLVKRYLIYYPLSILTLIKDKLTLQARHK